MSQRAPIPLPHSAKSVSCSLGLMISKTWRAWWRGDCWNTSCQWSTSFSGQFTDQTLVFVQVFFCLFRSITPLENRRHYATSTETLNSWTCTFKSQIEFICKSDKCIKLANQSRPLPLWLATQHSCRLMAKKVEHCIFLKCVQPLNSIHDALETTYTVWICKCFHISMERKLNRITLISAYRDIDFF